MRGQVSRSTQELPRHAVRCGHGEDTARGHWAPATPSGDQTAPQLDHRTPLARNGSIDHVSPGNARPRFLRF
jgi:hypothetical protein